MSAWRGGTCLCSCAYVCVSVLVQYGVYFYVRMCKHLHVATTVVSSAHMCTHQRIILHLLPQTISQTSSSVTYIIHVLQESMCECTRTVWSVLLCKNVQASTCGNHCCLFCAHVHPSENNPSFTPSNYFTNQLLCHLHHSRLARKHSAGDTLPTSSFWPAHRTGPLSSSPEVLAASFESPLLHGALPCTLLLPSLSAVPPV